MHSILLGQALWKIYFPDRQGSSAQHAEFVLCRRADTDCILVIILSQYVTLIFDDFRGYPESHMHQRWKVIYTVLGHLSNRLHIAESRHSSSSHMADGY